MTPLQQAAQAALEQWNFDSWVEDALMQTLSKALADEQAQAVEPVAWWIPKAEQFCLPPLLGKRPFAKAWEPLYAHPAPPPAGERDHVENNLNMVGARAELIARLIRKADAWDYLQPGAKRLNACRQAADMLEADATRITELEALSVTNILLDVVPGDGSGLEIFAKSTSDVVDLLTKMDEKIEDFESSKQAQQVAVPALVPLTAEQAREALIAAGVGTFYMTRAVTRKELWLTEGSADVMSIVRAVEAHHKTGAKP